MNIDECGFFDLYDMACKIFKHWSAPSAAYNEFQSMIQKRNSDGEYP